MIPERTRLPFRLLEIGTSAGLNLRWDRYRYEWPNGGWGQVSSAVRLENVFIGSAPMIPSEIEIAERAGCDTFPLDVGCDSGAITLLSYIWADQTERIDRSKAAIEIAHEVPCTIDKAHAADWLDNGLRTRFLALQRLFSILSSGNTFQNPNKNGYEGSFKRSVVRPPPGLLSRG